MLRDGSLDFPWTTEGITWRGGGWQARKVERDLLTGWLGAGWHEQMEMEALDWEEMTTVDIEVVA